jgi:hypothetical protein
VSHFGNYVEIELDKLDRSHGKGQSKRDQAVKKREQALKRLLGMNEESDKKQFADPAMMFSQEV